MNLFLYVIVSAVYIMTIHFAIAVKGQFNLFLMMGFFILGALLGSFLNSYDAGFVFAVILSLIFW